MSSPQRNYKDKNHKPELMVAMGEFWLLHGFKPKEELREILQTVNELHFFYRYLKAQDTVLFIKR
ncbi:MAG: type I phosphomannose isomerase catalytic subunit [Bacteroidota bacterium]